MASAESIRIRQAAARDVWQQGGAGTVNVGQGERLASNIGGGVLVLAGMLRGGLSGLTMTLLGGALLYRGVTGHCHLYEALGASTSDEGRGPSDSVPAQHGARVEEAITINRSPEELYRFWRNFENLPRFMNHLKAVTVTGGDRSHWVAEAPLGQAVEWDAEIHNERPHELIAWRSLEGSQVQTAGSVHFVPAPGGRGTEVRVNLKYNPPAGQLGIAIAKLFGTAADQQVRDDLRRLKQIMETGEIPTTEGQPSGQA
ncbi:MAG TPA: SRPBCC family protein [Isosphaeraceae bacterium]|jgi:uncharacterized membrane protein